jgi:caa(3)-type oxidase subunit IV
VDTNNTTVNYKEERVVYYKILIGLLLLTALTFIQPHMFMAESTFAAQMIIAVIKAWLIVMYYMHLKGETLIGVMGIFTLLIVATFFIIVIGFDVANFQFGAESHITGPESAGAAATASGHK